MADTVNLEQAEKLVTQLLPREQMKLVARICEQLSVALPNVPTAESTKGWMRQEQLAKLDAWLAECEKVAALWEGKFDCE